MKTSNGDETRRECEEQFFRFMHTEFAVLKCAIDIHYTCI